MFSNLAISLIEHKRINTTLVKAKELRRYIEPLITKSKDNTTHSRRVVFSYLNNKEAVKELFSGVAEKVGDRPGGYVRVIRTGFRHGDGAEMAMIEFVDFNTDYTGKISKETTDSKTKRIRRRGGAGKTAVAGGAVAVAATAVATEVEVEEESIEPMDEAVADAFNDEVTNYEKKAED